MTKEKMQRKSNGVLEREYLDAISAQLPGRRGLDWIDAPQTTTTRNQTSPVNDLVAKSNV
jgi:hypothetical protein